MATEFDAIYIDIQAEFDSYLIHKSSESACDKYNDRIHPNDTGNMLIARAFLSGIDFNEE
jgi:hypothetical protein